MSILKLFEVLEDLDNSKIIEEIFLLENDIKLKVKKEEYFNILVSSIYLFSSDGSTLFKILYSKNDLYILGTFPNTKIFENFSNQIRFDYEEVEEIKEMIESEVDDIIISLVFKGRDSHKSFSILNSEYFDVIYKNRKKIRFGV